MSEGEQFHHVDKAWTYKFQSDPALPLCGPVTSTPSSQPLAPNDAFRKSAYWHGLQRLAFGPQRTAATALLPLLTRFTRELQMCTAVVWDIRSPEITKEQNWIYVCRKLMITLLLRHFNTVVSAPLCFRLVLVCRRWSCSELETGSLEGDSFDLFHLLAVCLCTNIEVLKSIHYFSCYNVGHKIFTLILVCRRGWIHRPEIN